MKMLQQLRNQYDTVDCRELGSRQLEILRNGLKGVEPDEISSAEDGKAYIELLRKFREAVAENDKLHGDNYPVLLNSLLSVGEDGLYSNSLRFIFELIQNVDDCDYHSADDCRLDMRFDFDKNEIVLTYNEVGFTPFNVFAITGIAEAAKNISSAKNEIGEKGIGFKSVFGVAKRVRIRSGWFSFELYKENFTIPISSYQSDDYCPGTQMTLYVPGRAEQIYREIKNQYCQKDALFSKNPLLFLNKLTALKVYFDTWRSMEFTVSRSDLTYQNTVNIEHNVEISVNLHDYENGTEVDFSESVICSRYSYPVVFSREACQSRYGENTPVGNPNGKSMILRVVMPNLEYVDAVGVGALYSFLPTQLKLTVPLVCHVPFKLGASREFVDPQDENLWFQEASGHLSKLIEDAYMDWRSVVKEDIVRYLPGAGVSLFEKNNGKERCLSRQKTFLGAHYLELPLFVTIDGSFHTADEVFCFDQEEAIAEPEKVYRMMGYHGHLFISPIPVAKFRFRIERNVKNKLFQRSFAVPSITSEALAYLDSVDYFYDEKQIPNQAVTRLTSEQIETMFRHTKLASLLKAVGCNAVQKNKRLNLTAIDSIAQSLTNVLYEDFELSEAPHKVEQYLRICNEQCICLDIKDNDYLPCNNAVILSKENPLSSFAAFCSAIDPQDAFAIRIKLREASKRLNQYVEEDTGSASEYLHHLRTIRLLIKESIGNRGYQNYIRLILDSGIDKGRFIQELLQNADDCQYLPGAIPSFSLLQEGNVVSTEYNETGFNRANIRSITAIGESTKNKLLDSQFTAIGEKGVGFKTVFSIASEVRIYSGEYAFSLSDREPTIPREIEPYKHSPVTGTRMEIRLKEHRTFPTFNEKDLLELCLCLRKLRSIKIGPHAISIDDDGDRRTIVINKRQYVFKRFTHTFTISDERALKERRGETRAISQEQSIICYVPEKSGFSDYALYSGLPTKHRIKIPMAIDAPFALTTSREEIETDSSAWNNIIRREFYMAIMSVIDVLKTSERSKVFRFIRFSHRRQGTADVYVNDISDCEYLISFDFMSVLKSSAILPTFDGSVFQKPANKNAFRFPAAATFLFGRVHQTEYAGIHPSSIIDVEGTEYDAALNALECVPASFGQVFPIIEAHAEHFVRQDEFRSKLYEFLKEAPNEFRDRIKSLAIIPVFGKYSGIVEYIKWEEDCIFVKKGASESPEDYYVLNETFLPKSACETIYDSNINEMNAEWERSKYNERLNQIVHGSDIDHIYQYLIEEYRSGRLERNKSFPTLYAVSDLIPMKNELGEIVDTGLFLCDQPVGYFPVNMIQRLIIHRECVPFAKFMKRNDLRGIHYEDVDYYETLTADDIEILTDDYFLNSEEILRGFYRDELLPDELLSEYKLEYLAIGRPSDDEESYQFPSDPVGDRKILQNHVNELWKSPVKVVSVKEERTVSKGKNKDGTLFNLWINDARDGALRLYAPEGAHNLCFCQRCHRVKPNRLIEVNNIEVLPRYYFPQLRIALCLECSKRFEYLRDNPSIRDGFIAAIKKAEIHNQGTVDIRIGHDDTITFTAKHLAEIQEILRRMPTANE